jgi:tripartite ATP-independent transporter DctM subunit
VRGEKKLIIFLLFIILLLLGVPIVFALLAPGILACVFFPEIPIQLMSVRLANSFFSSTLLAIPLFIFAAQVLADIEITDTIFGFVNKCVGHVRGGLAQVNVIASVVFAGMSGSATADAVSLGKVEIEAMKKQGYPTAFSTAVTAASATIGPIIPPSIPVIIVGSIAGISIGKLSIGGFIPGIILAIVQMIQISLIAKHRNFPKTKFAGIKEIWQTAVKAFPGLMAPVILIGGMLSGFFTPTEAATVAAVYAMVIGFILKTLTFKKLGHIFKQVAMDSAAMLITFIGASLIGLLVTRLHMADATIKFISGLTTSPAVLLLIINILLLIAGCLLDPICALILFTPILMPLVKSFGINDVHFGIVMILNLMIGMITPPMGGLLFVTCRVAELKLTDLLKEMWPFIIWLVIALIIVTYVPQTVLWLPSLVMK